MDSTRAFFSNDASLNPCPHQNHFLVNFLKTNKEATGMSHFKNFFLILDVNICHA